MENIEHPLKDIVVERTDDNRVCFQWDYNGKPKSVSIYRALSADTVETPVLVLKTEQSKIYIKDQQGNKRFYYLLVPENTKGTWVAERRVAMEGTVNFRDLGGYKAEDGRQIKWGIIFRGDSLQRATDSDLKLLKQMNIREVFDFRREEEVKKGPNKFPENYQLNYHHHPVVHGEFNFISAMERLKINKSDWIREETIVKGYIDNTVKFALTWGKVMKRLAMDDCPPLFFHCTAGKDRTGICAALILSALGIPRETILSDYLLSNPYIKVVWIRVQKMIKEQGINPEKLAPFFSAPEYAMNSLLDHLETEFGGTLNFIRNHTGINQNVIEEFKKRVLE